MNSRIAVAKTMPLSTVLNYVDLRSYVFTMVFVALGVSTPWVFHQFHLAGATFLPMHIFLLTAGLLFGWRAGLIIGLLTPLASYAVSGMPVLAVLPQITIELMAYGLIAGLLREKFNLKMAWCLLGAMIGGRLALVIAVTIIYAISGGSYSPLGAEANPLFVLGSVVKQGWPGIVIQLVSVPLLVILGGRFLKGDG